MSLWTWLWIGWLAVFLMIEIPAVVNSQRGDTLSEHLWMWLGIGQRHSGWVWLRRLALVCFTAWLVIHVFSSGWI